LIVDLLPPIGPLLATIFKKYIHIPLIGAFSAHCIANGCSLPCEMAIGNAVNPKRL